MAHLLFGLFVLAIAAVLGFYGSQLAREGWTEIFSPPTAVVESTATRPYVIFTGTELVVPSDRSKPVQVTFDLKNTGQTQAIGSFSDFTYYFSTQPKQHEFAYQHSDPISFSLAPAEQWRGYFLTSFLLSPEKLEALNAGKARLFVYAKGEYRDATGKSYQIPLARMYHPVVAGNLAICPDNVVFK